VENISARGAIPVAPTIYCESEGDGAKVHIEAKRVYGSKYQILEVSQKWGFVPAKLLIGPRGILHGDGKSNVLCMFIINSEGRVIDAHILKTTDRRISTSWDDSFRSRKYEPARFRGVPVASIGFIESLYPPVRPERDDGFRKGLGIQGNRDR
jgi:hypothetical protein